MNKRMRKKHRLRAVIGHLTAGLSMVAEILANHGELISDLQTADHLQQETMEKLGDELATVKRELASLERVVKANAAATNNQLESLDGKIKKVADDLVIKTAKKGFWRK